MAVNLDPIVFSDNDLKPKEVLVELGAKRFVLREASVDAATTYKNDIAACARYNSEGKPNSFQGMASVDPKLLAACLFERYDPKDLTKERPVTLAFLKTLPDAVGESLIKRLKEISPTLAEEAETPEAIEAEIAKLQERAAKLRAEGDPAKNVPSSTTDSSD